MSILRLPTGQPDARPLYRVLPFEIKGNPGDRRSYLAAEVANRVKILAAHDPNTDELGVALSVAVGENSDPPLFDCMAHFAEHAVGNGTKSNSGMHQFREYVKQKGGESNAETLYTATDFYMILKYCMWDKPNDEVEIRRVDEIVGRFIEMQVEPSLEADKMEEELIPQPHMTKLERTIDRNYRNEEIHTSRVARSRRIMWAIRNECSIRTRRSIRRAKEDGGADAMKIIHAKTVEFIKSHYVAEDTTVVVVGPQSANDLMEIAAKHAARIDRQKPADPNPEMIFRKMAAGTGIFVPHGDTSIEDWHALSVHFQLSQTAFRNSIIYYIEYVFECGGKSALIDWMKSKGLAKGLKASINVAPNGDKELVLHIDLLDKGFDEIELVLQGIFAYCDKIRKHQPSREIHDHLRAAYDKLSEQMAKEKIELRELKILSHQLREYSLDDVMTGPFRMSDFDAGAIQTALDEFTTANFYCTVLGQDQPRFFSAAKKVLEPVYEYEYWVIDCGQFTKFSNPTVVMEFKIDKMPAVDDLSLPHKFVEFGMALIPARYPEWSCFDFCYLSCIDSVELELQSRHSENTPDQLDDEEESRKIPDLVIAQLRFLITHPDFDRDLKRMELGPKLRDAVFANDMAPFYVSVCNELDKSVDKKILADISEKNETRLREFEDAINDAEQNMGDTELRDAWHRKAEYLCQIGDKENCMTAFRKTYDQTVDVGRKIELLLQQVRVGFFFMDHHLIAASLSKARDFIEQNGDWDWKNRLKVYEALHALAIRDFKMAANRFLDSLSTFTALELMTYEQLVFYAVVTAMLVSERSELKDKIICCADIQQHLSNQLEVRQYLMSLHECDYGVFFAALAKVEHRLKFDRIIAHHHDYYTRAMRVKAYQQLLSSNRSVKLKSMAEKFGISTEFLENDLNELIASNDLNCKVDAVNGVVEMTQMDSKSSQYREVIKAGDVLLSRLQDLSRLMDA